MNNKQNNNTLLWVIAGAAIILCCCCLFMLGAGGIGFGLLASSNSSAGPAPLDAVTVEVVPASPSTQPARPSATPRPTQPAGQSSAAPTPAAEEFLTEMQLQEAVVPARNLRVLSEELRGTGPIPEVVNDTTPTYQLNEQQKFWINNDDTGEHFQIDARLAYVNDVLYMWVEDGANYDPDDLKDAADKFAEQTYPTDRNFFGSEWNPGVDNDPRLHILHSEQLGDRIAGYFSGADEVSNLAQPFSNEREMFYINIDNTKPNTEFYNGVLAHEFQHMIHWYQDKNESSWVNEGMSELASELNGYDRGGADYAFSDRPDTQLNAWSDDPNGRTEHYGNAYLFMSYFLQRFGNQLTQDAVASDANGIDGFNEALAKDNTGVTFDDVFADWVVANLLDDPDFGDGRYGYERDDLQPMALDVTHRRYPVQRETDVSQYAADYIELSGSGDVRIDFQGATTASLANTSAHSGEDMWWANRVDDSDARLTRAFDLSGVDSATLNFWTWFDIEDDWDYGYVMASTDGGETWTPLATQDTTEDNPNGNSFGPALTGCSGDPSSQEAGDECNAQWIEQTADLTPFAGNADVLVRFQYITDDAVNYPGFFVDDISIPEIGYTDDAESDGEWVSEGWIRTDNTIRQRWLVQLIEMESGADPVITQLEVDGNGQGSWNVDNLGRGKTAILAISAMAPVTTEKAQYQYSITQQ
ncbi:MAG: immune inhibitor A [Caldilineae bacterium]|nr:immune inhibitor A [Caldilineae bacterium]